MPKRLLSTSIFVAITFIIALSGFFLKDLIFLYKYNDWWFKRSEFIQEAKQLVVLDQSQPVENLKRVSAELPTFLADIAATQLLSRDSRVQLLINNREIISVLNKLLSKALNEQLHVVLLLQNQDEIRASGGFLGSFATISWQKGSLKRLEVTDIYEADGQLTSGLASPPGQEFYLSGGNGLRLPDANWSASFPESAQTILTLLAQAGWENIDIVVAINSSLIEHILELTGPLYLPDYTVTVTPDNISQLARADRSQFFAGSNAKPQFLQTLLTQLKLAWQNKSVSDYVRLAQLIKRELDNGQIMLYAVDPTAQSEIENIGIAGTLPTHSHWFYPLESNVGVNKANAKVTRTWSISLNNAQLTAQAHYLNANQRTNLDIESLHYANYLRFVVPPGVTLTSVSINNQPITEWDRTQHDTYQEFGTLVAIPEQKTAELTATFIYPETLEMSSFEIVRQPGISDSQQIITFKQQ